MSDEWSRQTCPEQMNDHNKYMQRALELARLGLGEVSPNPMVGCVIVHGDTIIGEGWHHKYGESHAEVNAVNSVKERSLLSASTAYVTLEPCSHFGKNPPCADLLIKKGIKKVVTCNVDPNPIVKDKGIAKLKSAGVEVLTGILSEEGEELNKRFFTFYKKNRPYIILKWAQTQDRLVAKMDFDSKWISNEYSRRLVHQWRADEDAILVGTNTALYDNPRLNVRNIKGKNPLRLVIDNDLKLKSDLNLFDQSQPTICYNKKEDKLSKNLELVKITKGSIHDVLSDLHKRNVQSLIVEGGSQLLKSFLENNLWDEARVFTSSQTFGEGIEAPEIQGHDIEETDIQGDTLTIIRN